MREILFRGKNLNFEDEWLYGSLVDLDRESGYVYIIPPHKGASTLSPWELMRLKGRLVIPETVGQWTGLEDKNGVKIFEGDIVKCCGEYRSVVYNSRLLCFEFWEKDMVENPDGLELCADYELCEVIGNIYDNPELLKR